MIIIEGDSIISPSPSRIQYDPKIGKERYIEPKDDGFTVADRLLQEPDWKNVRFVLRHLPPERLISSFWNALFYRIHEQAPERLKDALQIEWDSKFQFMMDNIKFSHEGAVRLWDGEHPAVEYVEYYKEPATNAQPE